MFRHNHFPKEEPPKLLIEECSRWIETLLSVVKDANYANFSNPLLVFGSGSGLRFLPLTLCLTEAHTCSSVSDVSSSWCSLLSPISLQSGSGSKWASDTFFHFSFSMSLSVKSQLNHLGHNSTTVRIVYSQQRTRFWVFYQHLPSNSTYHLSDAAEIQFIVHWPPAGCSALWCTDGLGLCTEGCCEIDIWRLPLVDFSELSGEFTSVILFFPHQPPSVRLENIKVSATAALKPVKT